MSYSINMGKSYSEDLRQRAVSAVDSGQSKVSVSRIYSISRSTLDDWLLLRQQTGGLSPKRHAGRARLLQDTPVLRAFLEQHSQSTLCQMAGAWEHQTGQRLTIMTFCKTLRRLGYTHKKRAFSTESAVRKSAKSS